MWHLRQLRHIDAHEVAIYVGSEPKVRLEDCFLDALQSKLRSAPATAGRVAIMCSSLACMALLSYTFTTRRFASGAETFPSWRRGVGAP